MPTVTCGLKHWSWDQIRPRFGHRGHAFALFADSADSGKAISSGSLLDEAGPFPSRGAGAGHL